MVLFYINSAAWFWIVFYAFAGLLMIAGWFMRGAAGEDAAVYTHLTAELQHTDADMMTAYFRSFPG